MVKESIKDLEHFRFKRETDKKITTKAIGNPLNLTSSFSLPHPFLIQQLEQLFIDHLLWTRDSLEPGKAAKLNAGALSQRRDLSQQTSSVQAAAQQRRVSRVVSLRLRHSFALSTGRFSRKVI